MRRALRLSRAHLRLPALRRPARDRLQQPRAAGDARGLRKRWAARAASRDPRDVSGVWRYRELLPFDDAAPFVTLFEGNTPLYTRRASANIAAWTTCG